MGQKQKRPRRKFSVDKKVGNDNRGWGQNEIIYTPKTKPIGGQQRRSTRSCSHGRARLSLHQYRKRGWSVGNGLRCSFRTSWQRLHYVPASGAGGLATVVIGEDLDPGAHTAEPDPIDTALDLGHGDRSAARLLLLEAALVEDDLHVADGIELDRQG